MTGAAQRFWVSLGSPSWLAELDADDRAEAIAEIRDSFALAATEHDLTPLRDALHAWAVTAATMRNPKRRAVLTSPGDDSAFVEVDAPV